MPEPLPHNEVQQYVELVASVVLNLPLEEFVANAERALKVGKYVDAAAADETRTKLLLLRDNAVLLLALKKRVEKAKKEGVIT